MPHEIDPVWSFGQAVENNNFYGKVINRGITKFKQHLAHVTGNVVGYTEVPREVRGQMRALLNQNKARKVEIKVQRQEDANAARYDVFGDEALGDFDDEDDPQMATARRESLMTHQEEQKRRAFSGTRYNDVGGLSSVQGQGHCGGHV